MFLNYLKYNFYCIKIYSYKKVEVSELQLGLFLFNIYYLALKIKK